MTGMKRKRVLRPRWANAAVLASILLVAVGCMDRGGVAASVPPAGGCDRPGTWIDPGTAAPLAPEALVAAVARRPVVLLGEAHTDAEHHRWQLHMLGALHGRKSDMVLGFESFPRRIQPVLDQWVAGELDVDAFLKASEWRTVWGYDSSLYMPLFHFARQNRIPMIALNVERTLVSRVGREGWAAISEDERAGLSDPAPAETGYRKSLAEVYAVKQSLMEGAQPKGEVTEADVAAIMESEGFVRFVEAQLTWDRAMAEALAEARRRQPDALVVGIMGRGHVEHRYGVPHQLADLGIPDAAVLLPVQRMADCAELPSDLADAVFVVEQADRIEKPRPRPRLGIMIEPGDGGVRVLQVVEGSVAAAAAIEAGDIVLSAAGMPVASPGELIEIVQRQAPGTWLPLTVRRDGREIGLVAKFPVAFDAPE